MRLPRGEETLPILVVEGRMLTPQELREQYPELYRELLERRLIEITDELLIERVRRRVAQGREMTIYRWEFEITPEEQLRHMELRDEIGLELIEAERKLLEWELAKLRE